jgi:cytoskeletal protein RodZ
MNEIENESPELNLFDKLREIRIQKGLTLENVAEKSRIQIKFLEALENGDLLKIPEVYDKLFFRSYLKALDLDENEYFGEFLEFRKSVRIDKTTSVIQINANQKDEDKKLFSHRTLFVVLPISLIIIVIVILLLNTEMVGTASEKKVQEINIVNVVERLEAKEKAKKDSIQLAKEMSAIQMLNIGARKRTWFRVVIDKKDTAEYLLNPSQKVDVKADSIFEFLIGRADGLELFLNGRSLSMSKSDSSVVRYMLVDSSGIVVKLLKSADQDTTNEN